MNEQEALMKLVESASTVIYGKQDQIKLIIATWLSGGHVLLEDYPGTGKTVLAKTLSSLIKCSLGRVQFTPDLLPADITGSSIYEAQSQQFRFEKGPIFCQFFLADEINRATPRTQSALLEAMSERQVTSDGQTLQLDKTFFVMATQNPIEHHGTFPLPEAQLDRFAIKINLGHMNVKEELSMIQAHIDEEPLNHLTPVMEHFQFVAIQKKLKMIRIDKSVYEYAVKIVDRTRKSPQLEIGCSPRATLHLLRISRALALMNGEDFVRPKYVYDLVPMVLGHRIHLSQESKFTGLTEEEFLKTLLKQIPPPTK